MKRIFVILLLCLSFLSCDKRELCDAVSQHVVSIMETSYVSQPQTNDILESRAATSSQSGPHLSAKGLSAHSDIAIIFSETESV